MHVARSYLAPLGIALAERIGSDWVTLDLDDDDEQLERSAGNEDAAASYGRLVAVFGPLFRRVSLAAPAEAAAVAARHGLAAVVVPNAVADDRAPEAAARAPGPVPGLSILFVGNLTYWPNADAARRLAREVLPAVGPLTAGPARGWSSPARPGTTGGQGPGRGAGRDDDRVRAGPGPAVRGG